MPRGCDRQAAVGKHRERGGQIERRHQARSRATATARPACRAGRRRTRAAAPARDPIRCCSTVAARLSDSSSAARSVSASGASASALRGDHSSGPCGATWPRSDEHRHRREAVLERRGVEERLERRSRLPAAAARAVELRLAEVAAADHREDVAGRADRSRPAPPADRDRRSAAGRPTPRAPPSPAAPGTNVVCTSQSGGWSPPN